MKAYTRGDRIVISKNEEYKEIEKLINQLYVEVDKLKMACEDRTTEDFPVDVVRRIIGKCNMLRNKGEDVKISDEYLNFMYENKSALEYYQSIIDNIENEKSNFIKKTEYLRKFSEMLDK